MSIVALLGSAATGCVFDGVGNGSAAAKGGGVDGGSGECAKIEGADIGREGVTLNVGGLTAVFTDWVGKTDSPGEFVGFTITINGGVADVVVKAGNDRYAVSGSTWTSPAGLAGPDAHGVSNVEVCDPPDDGSCNDPDGCGGGGGGSGDCNDPDGCPDGGGGGGGDGCTNPDGCDGGTPPVVL